MEFGSFPGKVQFFLAKITGMSKIDRSAVAVRQRLVSSFLFLLAKQNGSRALVSRCNCKSAKLERAIGESNAAAFVRSIFLNPVIYPRLIELWYSVILSGR